MKKKIFILIILLFIVFYILSYFIERPVCYDIFPTELQHILDDRVAELKSEGGICIAGRVKMSDGAHIRSGEDVMVNLYHGIDKPLWVYDGGWFIMDRAISSSYAGDKRGFVLRAFGYEPINASITIIEGEITYLEFIMKKTPSEELSSVSGIVTDDRDKPFEGAKVSLKFPFANHGYRAETGYTYPYMEMTTGRDGRYCFEGLSVGELSVVAFASGYAYDYRGFSPPAGGAANENLKLYPNQSIVVDFVYQTDGSRDFVNDNILTGTVEWVVGSGGIDFSDGGVEGYESDSLRDIEMRQRHSVLQFAIFYVKGDNGFYDTGAVDFDSVTEAPETGYSTRPSQCIEGHTYLVKTYEGNYAKFIVLNIREK